MKLSYVLLASPFVASVLAAPGVTEDLNEEQICAQNGGTIDNGVCEMPFTGLEDTTPECAKGQQPDAEGNCMTPPTVNNKNNKEKNNNNKGNIKGKKPNKNGKKQKPNKNGKTPKIDDLTLVRTLDEMMQKNYEKMLKKEEKEQQKKEKKDDYATDMDCNVDTHDVIGRGDTKSPFECVEKCDVATPYRSWVDGVEVCHDCLDESVYTLVEYEYGVALDAPVCKKNKDIEGGNHHWYASWLDLWKLYGMTLEKSLEIERRLQELEIRNKAK